MSEQILIWLITLIVAGMGAWFGSYLREKGKNYATKEDIQSLTRLTEEVRAEISGKVWVDQKRWDLRRDFYWQLLGVLSEFTALMQRYKKILPSNIKDIHEVEQLKKEFNSVTPIFVEKSTRLTHLLGIGRIILPQPVVVTLDDFEQRLQGMDREGSVILKKINAEVSPEDIANKNPDEILKMLESKYEKMRVLGQESVGKFISECERVTRLVVQAAREDLLSLEGSAE